MNCALCDSSICEINGAGRAWLRCDSQDAGQRRGRVVGNTMPRKANMQKIGVDAPAWCPKEAKNDV